MRSISVAGRLVFDFLRRPAASGLTADHPIVRLVQAFAGTDRARQRIYVYFTIGSAGIKLVQIAFSQFLLATNRPGVVLISTIIGVGVNAIAAFVMVFGLFGVKPMGVTVAALGW